MKRVILGLLTVITLMIAGCGGGGTVEVYIPPEPPTITLNDFSKDSYTEHINGNVSYFAPDSDIDSITIVVRNSSGYEMDSKNLRLNLADISSGTIPFSIDYYTYPSEYYPYIFSIYVTDFNGNVSNLLVETFYVP